MTGRTTEDEFKLSTQELIRTFNAFEKAAKEFLVASERVRKEKGQELKGLSEEIKSIQEFLVQITDESGQMGKLSFGLRYMNVEEKDQE